MINHFLVRNSYSSNAAILMRNRDGSEQQTLNNANLFISFVDVIQRYGDGFVEYQWTKPLKGGGVTQERYTKLSYVVKAITGVGCWAPVFISMMLKRHFGPLRCKLV